MVAVNTDDIKILRERTGAGMMDCKKALVACESKIEDAIDWLRKKGLATAAKKSGRIAAEGLVGLCVCDNNAAILEVNAETDFVSRNDKFKDFVQKTTCLVCKNKYDIEALKNASNPKSGLTVSEELTNLIVIVGEHMALRRAAVVSVENGVIASYVHNKISDNLGKIGILVTLESSGDKNRLLEFGKKIAMHIAAANPQSLSIEDLDPAVLERERGVFVEQAKAMGKPEEFVSKIVDGRIRKFYEEAVLLEQVFVIDGTLKVREIIENFEKELETPVKLSGFVKFVLGEGIEKQVVDFATEVAAQLS